MFTFIEKLSQNNTSIPFQSETQHRVMELTLIMSQYLKHVCYTAILNGYHSQVTSQVHWQGI